MRRTGSTVIDSTSNSNDGSPSSFPTASTGKIGGALDFDGINDYVSLDGQSLEDHDYGAFTFSTWYRSTHTTVSDDQYIYNAQRQWLE